MASTFAVTRNHLIFGICLPVALLLGYLLADAQDPTSTVIVALGFGVLSFPLLIKWYHPALVPCWNMNAQPTLPGQPELWAVMAFPDHWLHGAEPGHDQGGAVCTHCPP